MSDAVSRIVRSLLQLGVGQTIAQLIAAFVDLTSEQGIAVGGAITFLLIVIQNVIEAKTDTKLLAPTTDLP
jgi:hypothetical protein